MKRREFLKRTGQAVLLTALPVAMLTASKTDVTVTEIAPRHSIEEWIRESLKKKMQEDMDKAAFEQMYSGTRVIAHEIGSIR